MRNILSIVIHCRAYNTMYESLFEADNIHEVRNITGCMKPCNYGRYNLINKLTKSAVIKEDICQVSLWVGSPDTTVQTEVLS